MARPTPFSWTPYAPPPGSYVELFDDGTFRLEGHDALFTQDETVALHNAPLAASKEPGVGQPLSLHLFRGAKPLHVLLCYGDLDGSGAAQWFRHAAKSNALPNSALNQSSGHPSPAATRPLSQAISLPRVHDGWFKIGFFVFLFWYLFAHHQVFRGVPATVRYPSTVPKSSEDDYAPPEHVYRP